MNTMEKDTPGRHPLDPHLDDFMSYLTVERLATDKTLAAYRGDIR